MVKACAFANRMIAPRLYKALEHKIVDEYVGGTARPYYAAVIYAFAHLPPTSPVLRVMIDAHSRAQTVSSTKFIDLSSPTTQNTSRRRWKVPRKRRRKVLFDWRTSKPKPVGLAPIQVYCQLTDDFNSRPLRRLDQRRATPILRNTLPRSDARRGSERANTAHQSLRLC